MRFPMGLVAVAVLFADATAIAATPTATEYLNESQQFDQIFKSGKDADTVPRVGQKADKALIEKLSDSKKFLDSQTFTLTDMPVLMEMCGQAHAKVMNYFQFGGANSAAQMQNNLALFQDELSYLFPFDLKCTAKTVPLLAKFVQSLKPEEFNDARRDGLKRMQQGAFMTFNGLLIMIHADPTQPGLKDTTVTAFADALADTADTYASAMHLSDRQKVLAEAKTIQANAPKPLQEDLAKIIKALTDARCEGLCKL